MGELSNCPKCNGLFVKTIRNVCQDCYKEEEQAFRTVYDYLKKRQNRQATMEKIEEETGVEKKLIMKFVQEKRLRPSQFPNLSYPCQKCGKGITEGKLCSKCSNDLVADLNQQDEVEQVARKNKAQENKANTYFSVNKYK